MSTKRLLTEKEIENILDFIKPYERIPYETAMSIVYEAKRKLRNQLVNVEIYPEIIPELKKELEKNYNDCKISPGESVGILCAQSIGEKNTQNSVAYEENIVLKHKNNIFQTTIGYFIDKLMIEDDMYEDNNYLKKLNGDFEILTISQEENIEWKTISEISKHPTNGDLVKIRTETGREVTTTLSHSHLKRENDEVLPILGSELKIGDRVPVMRKSPMVILEEKNSEEILMAWFYGVYTAFGSISNKGDFLIVKNTNTKTNELFDFSLRLLLSDLDTKYSIKLENKFFYAIYSSKMIEIIDLHFGNENEVPECVYNWGEKKLKAFLRGFLEENGFISKSKSKLVSIQHLLTRFGIHSRIETLTIDDKLSFYTLYIQNKYYDLFRQVFPTLKIDEKLFEKDYETIHPDVKDVENYKSDVVWEKIVDIQIIKECDYNYSYVYDFSVKGNETFGLMNGIVVHNTLNSIDWTEKILYNKDNNAVVEPIGQMIDNLLLEFPDKIEKIPENRTEYLPLNDGYYIPSSDENGWVDWYKIEAVTRHLPVGKLVKVVTQSGRSTVATQSKSFLVWSEKERKFLDTEGSKVKVGDILPTTHTLPMFTTTQEYFDLETIFPKNEYLYTDEVIKAMECKKFGKKGWNEHNGKSFTVPYNRPDSFLRSRKDYFSSCPPGLVYIYTSNTFVSHMTSKILLDDDFGFILGIYLADGWATETFVGISKNDPVIRKRVTDWCDKYSITTHLVTSEGKNVRKGTTNDLKIHSTLLARMLKNICNTGSKNKFIPLFAYNAPKEFLKGLIGGYFSGDGTVNKDDGYVSCCSISEQLIHGISFLLSYFSIFGVISSVQQKKNNVGSKNIHRLYSLTIRNDYAKRFAREFTLTENKKNSRLQNITLKKEYKFEYGKSQEEFPLRDVYFDEVVSVELVDGTTEYVYDLTVEKTRNFELYNGLNLKDTFHKCGQSERSVVQGVPRFQELLNATKSPKNVNCKIYFNEGNETLKELRETVSSNIVCLTLKDVSESIEIRMNKEKEEWYENFKLLYNDEFSAHEHCISIKLEQKKLFKYRIELKEISDKIESVYDDLYCVFSPQDKAQLDIFIDISRIKFTEKQLLFITEENANEIYIEECVQPILEKLILFGVQGIENIYFSKDDKTDEWYVETDGSNFRKLLGHPIIDYTRLLSNNMWDIYETLGIEATREFLVNEFESIMEGINLCHVKLLVERMTFSGNINSISRYTLRKDDAGVLSKASFEESTDNFIKAGFSGEIEKTVGVSASIICGKRANIGSGFMDLKMNLNYLDDSIPIFKDENNDGVVIENKGGYSKFKMYTNLETDT